MKTFEFKQTFEEVKIGDKVYKIDLSDDNVKKYQKLFSEFQKESADLQDAANSDLTPEMESEFINKAQEMIGIVVNTLLGDGAFDELYVSAGKSILNMLDLVTFLVELIGEKTNDLKNSRLDKYLKK